MLSRSTVVKSEGTGGSVHQRFTPSSPRPILYIKSIPAFPPRVKKSCARRVGQTHFCSKRSWSLGGDGQNRSGFGIYWNCVLAVLSPLSPGCKAWGSEAHREAGQESVPRVVVSRLDSAVRSAGLPPFPCTSRARGCLRQVVATSGVSLPPPPSPAALSSSRRERKRDGGAGPPQA